MEERLCKKVFQNYFTNVLYNRINFRANIDRVLALKNEDIEPHEHFQPYFEVCNRIWNEACSFLWQSIFNSFYPNVHWSQKWSHFRFFLKGGKSQYNKLVDLAKEKPIDSRHWNIQRDDTEYDTIPEPDPFMRTPNIAAVLASEMLPKIKNSDFDFTFVINPDFLISSQYDTDEILARLNYEMANCAARCVQLFNENSQSLQEFVNAVNAPENLKNLWVAVDDVLTNLSTERVSDELREILTTKRSEIKFTLDSPQIKFFKPSRPIINNSIYLFRIVVPILSGVPELDDRGGFFSMFAEGIDVAWAISLEERQSLWDHSGFAFMDRPIPLVERNFNPRFGYPVANLAYLIQDTLVIFLETNPSKPEKRCEAFLRMLYLSCVEQKLKAFPRYIKVSNEVWSLLNTSPQCQQLLQLFMLQSRDEFTVTLKVSSALQNIDEFESWCMEKKHPWGVIPHELPKSKIIKEVQAVFLKIFNDKKFLAKLPSISKDQCILYWYQFRFYGQIQHAFLVFKHDATLTEHSYQIDFSPSSLNVSEKQKQIGEVTNFILKSLNSLRPPTSIFSLVEANKDLCKRNSFAALLSKFKFVAVQ